MTNDCIFANTTHSPLIFFKRPILYLFKMKMTTECMQNVIWLGYRMRSRTDSNSIEVSETSIAFFVFVNKSNITVLKEIEFYDAF